MNSLEGGYVPHGLIEMEPSHDGLPVDFMEFLGKRNDRGGSIEDQQKNLQILRDHGLQDIEPTSLPGDFYVLATRVSQEDWDWVADQKYKLLALYSTLKGADISADCRYMWEREAEVNNIPSADLVAQLHQLPFVYQTNLSTLEKIVGSGQVLSDRKYRELLMQQGKNPDSVDDLQDFTTHTYADDRRAGLDNYVFTTFGLPKGTTSGYGSVQILFKPDQLAQGDDCFATRSDYIDLIDNYGEDKASDHYRDQVCCGKYFYRNAARGIVNTLWENFDRSKRRTIQVEEFLSRNVKGGINGDGEEIGWEVKAPTFTTEEIDKIVFTDLASAKQFREKFEDRYPIILRPGKQELARIVGQMKGNNNYVNMFSEEELLQLVRKYFSENPQEVSNFFGDIKVCFKDSELYLLSDASARYKKALMEELNSRPMEKINEIECLPVEEKKTVYLELEKGFDLVTERADIYRAPTGIMFENTEQAQQYLDEKKRRRKHTLQMAIPGQGIVSRPDPKLTLVELEVAKSELASYERSFSRDPFSTELLLSKPLTKYRVISTLILE